MQFIYGSDSLRFDGRDGKASKGAREIVLETGRGCLRSLLLVLLGAKASASAGGSIDMGSRLGVGRLGMVLGDGVLVIALLTPVLYKALHARPLED